ncbi:cytidine deaminase [Cyclobacterium lianum]|uniref:Cytidine deaminase n=1 Tax=Cyclobacterium lianum TaxID=388280 RepID=A0A1M7PRW1_9BACT|nr:cytidine deaminase [Cyclobacterium lianum]SHN20119.1 cytidine deaminase [Cyclobacterium lianum]
MKENQKITFTQTLSVIPLTELDAIRSELIAGAKKASGKAYAPYSNFRVGAAVILEDGQIFTANNQENICFPVGVCAERILLGYTHANQPDLRPAILAIVAQKSDNSGFATVSPCGLCRQSISEYEMKFKHPIEILMYRPDGTVLQANGIDALLPFKFEDLNQ